MDVKNFFPHCDGLEPLRYFLNKRPDQNPPTSTILQLAELDHTMNYFEFDEDYYHQTRGIAMDTHMGPTYANLFMGFLEYKL